MMMLLFKIDSERYSLSVADVVELVPYVSLQNLPKAPEYIAGLMNYRGNIVPVVDLSILICDRPVKHLMSSRIILIKPAKEENRFIGLLAENVTEAIKIDEATFTDTGVSSDAGAFVDKIAMDESGMIQVVNVSKLLPDDVKIMLQDNIASKTSTEGQSDVV